MNPSNTRRLRNGIISEVENITRLWTLCEELDKNCDTKESLLAEIESLKFKLSKKPEDADVLEDQMESVEGQLQYINSKVLLIVLYSSYNNVFLIDSRSRSRA
jgi:hypothetical protein